MSGIKFIPIRSHINGKEIKLIEQTHVAGPFKVRDGATRLDYFEVQFTGVLPDKMKVLWIESKCRLPKGETKP